MSASTSQMTKPLADAWWAFNAVVVRLNPLTERCHTKRRLTLHRALEANRDRLRVPEPNSVACTIFQEEFDPGLLQGFSNRGFVRGCHGNFPF
jgi:hypothetical protein